MKIQRIIEKVISQPETLVRLKKKKSMSAAAKM